MKILSIGNFVNPSWDGSIPDEEHIAGALEDLGHQVRRQQRDDTTWIHSVQFDFILIAQWDGYPPELMQNLKDQGKCPIVYWAFDYQANDQPWHLRLVDEADLYLSKRLADIIYPNWQWLSQDFAPKFLDKWEGPISVEKYEQAPLDKEIDVLFTGSYLPWATERNETLKAVDDKFNLVIHSVNEWPGFKDQRGPLMDTELPYLYSRARVILSIDHTLEAGYWSDRNAQILSCGGRPLFRYIPLSEARFGKDVDYFYSIEDCLEKIQQLLDDPVTSSFYGDKYKVGERVRDLLTIVRSIL